MIRINLQPAYRSLRRQSNIYSQLFLFILIFICAGGGVYYYDMMISTEITTLEEDNDQTRLEIQKFKRQSQEVDRLQRDLAMLKKKLTIIESLALNRRDALGLMDMLIRSIIQKRMWYSALQSSKSELSIQGIALDDKTVSDFMKRLEESKTTYCFSQSFIDRLKNEKMFEEPVLKQFEDLINKEFIHMNEMTAMLDNLIQPPLTEEEKLKIAQFASQPLFSRIILKKTERITIEDKLNLKRFDIVGLYKVSDK